MGNFPNRRPIPLDRGAKSATRRLGDPGASPSPKPAVALARAGKPQGNHVMRITPTRNLVAGSLAAVLIAGLAGCGGGDTKDNAAQGTTSGSPSTDPSASAAPSDSATTSGALTPASTGNP